MLRQELRRGWEGVRYLVPTVGHKRSIECLLLERGERKGLLGDPVTTFFNFAEEVARRAALHPRRLSEVQKYLVLKKIAREAKVDYFDRARRFPGFVQALGETIDELKVHMVWADELTRAAQTAGTGAFARKIGELGLLYAQYQEWVRVHDLYDNEGLMWIATELLRDNASLFGDLHCLILDGFARLTPIQVEFLRLLAPRLQRTIVLFDHEEHRTVSYHPVEDSLAALMRAEALGGFTLERRLFPGNANLSGNANLPIGNNNGANREIGVPGALATVRTELFRGRGQQTGVDNTLHLLIGATPAHEAELIARAVRALLRDGMPAGDIAILARNAEAVQERLARTFQRFGLSLREEPPPLAHTPPGRALLAVLRLARDGWKREDVLALLKSGMLEIDPAVAFQLDLIARTRYLRDRKSTWVEGWPDEDGGEALRHALAPLAAFDDDFHRREVDAAALLRHITDILAVFRVRALPAEPPLPDVQPDDAARHVRLDAAFTKTADVLTELQTLEALLAGGFRREELVELITSALVRAHLPASGPATGIPVLSVHATGGEKFRVVFLCNLLQGVFPHHQRESAFLLDHEREEALPALRIALDPRRHLEEDEQCWFLHAFSSAGERLYLSYPRHDAAGSPLERSIFMDEVLHIVPTLETAAQRTQFRDVAPPLEEAEQSGEFLARLALEVRTARDDEARARAEAAYTAAIPAYGQAFAALFRRAAPTPATLTTSAVLALLAARTRPFSASELQVYLDCPFHWFGANCLGVEEISEEFSALDRGLILHAVLEQLYRDLQPRPGVPVVLNEEQLTALWPRVQDDLRTRLEREPRFANRAAFLRDIEWERLCRMLQRFLKNEVARAQTRRLHPAYFEHHFGSSRHAPLPLGDGSVHLRGVIDRIDLSDDNPEEAVVVDYKSSAVMSLRELEGGKILQAPIYALALARLTGFTPLGVEFMGLKQGEAKAIYRECAQSLQLPTRGVKWLADDAWQAFLDENEARICAAAAAIRAGLVDLAPTTPRCPRDCEFFAICRGERFALEEQVRAAK